MKETNSDIIRQLVRDRYAKAAGDSPCGCRPAPGSACCGSSATASSSLGQIMGYSEKDLAGVVDGANLGAWSLESKQLPARRQALAQWPGNDAYINFIQLELERAQANPTADSDPILSALGNAVFDVISFSTTAQEAAAEAITTLQP